MKKRTPMLVKIRESRISKIIACYLMLTIVFDVAYPTLSLALTGGPSQPEMGGFQPVDTSDMVDLSSGDFKYNIPIMDMDGYALNLSYNGGVTMDAEASWVGLGWNLNPGSINRSMRGVPDDFNGDLIKKTYSVKPSRNFGINTGLTLELFGLDSDLFSGSLTYTLGVNYSNYYGLGIQQSIGTNLGVQVGPLNVGLGLTSSSENGLTISPSASLSLSKKEVEAGKETTTIKSGSASLGVGTSYNTRAGVKQLSVNTSINYNKTVQDNATKSNISSKDRGLGVSGTFDLSMPTFTPTVGMPMHNISIGANFQIGFEAWGLHPSAFLGGTYTGQKLINTSRSNAAYGYMNLQNGQENDDAILDFNRENDGEFTTSTPHLPITNLTYDMYSVTGQGIGGSYRPFRSEIGHVFDPSSYSTSEGFNIGIEFGVPGLVHAAGDVAVNISETSSGRWSSNNAPRGTLRYGKKGSNVDHEMYYFKEANEKSVDNDPGYYASMGGDQAVRFVLDKSTQFNVKAKNQFKRDDGGIISVPNDNFRHKREKRNDVIAPLSIDEVRKGAGLEIGFPSNSYAATGATANAHHIGEITSYGTSGMRYVYGIPAYNTYQKEVSFATGKDILNQGGLTGNCSTGEVIYNSGDNSPSNPHGLDNSYNATETPPYAHSYLLTAVVSSDYIDSDNLQGPSLGDLGEYTKFYNTCKYPKYKWRTPSTTATNTANYNEGLKTDPTDDKANYIYGEKEIWYIDHIESKNYVAVFKLADRKDSYGVQGENGGIDLSQPLQRIESIEFYSRHDYYLPNTTTVNPNRVPLKVAHFEYDYSLCPNVPNNSGIPEIVGSTNVNAAKGKLTLTKVYFTFQNSNKARLSAYEFKYGTLNPSYDIKGYDRWGNYKPNTGGCSPTSPLNNAEFPFVEQNMASANTNSSAWMLNEILLPTGGKMKIKYESDDYGHVQNKKAMQMLKIVGQVSTPGGTPSPSLASFGATVDIADGFKSLLFELDPSDQTSSGAPDMSKYFNGVDDIYFKALMQTTVGKFDYTSGYSPLDPSDKDKNNNYIGPAYGSVQIGSTWYGYLRLKPVNFNDLESNPERNPITKAAIQFARIYLQRFVYTNPAITDADSFGQSLIASIFSSGLVGNLIANTTEFLLGPNHFLYVDPLHKVGAGMIMHKGWIRLNNPTGKKYGGGCRVKSIVINDQWSDMTPSGNEDSEYGQEYFYDENGNGTGASTGVASYEPQLGGEENPWKKPIAFEIEHKLAPDEKMYQEEPLGESFFPSPNICYGKVTTQNISYKNIIVHSAVRNLTRHATGKTVYEFYTSKDFPTIVSNTDRDIERDKMNPFSIASLFNIASRDYLTASEGFKVEVNDMHGKPKKQSVYQEGAITPITSIEYKYKQTPFGSSSFRLANNVTTLTPAGDIENKEVGTFFDMVADMRESKSKSCNINVNINGESFLIIVPIVVAPIPIPKIVRDLTQFRSATTTKVIQKFGILEEVITKDLGSMVSTKNLAFDSETGEVLLTQTTTNFNDAVYTLSYPAHWYYDKGMGQAYKNIGITLPHSFSSGVANYPNSSVVYVPGDELELIPSSGPTIKGWVTNVTAGSITVVNKAGNNVSGSYLTKITRSGRRNVAPTGIAYVTSLTNPITNFKNNLFSNVLQASSIEFNDQWRTFCDCFDPSTSNVSTNPYVLGTKGIWRMKRTFMHLSQRTQSHYNNNTNIRKDGVFVSFTPYYRLNAGNWMIDGKNWTFTSEITELSPFGQELETKDALGGYGSSLYGYRQSFLTATGSNTRYRQLAFDNFEDYGFSPCADNHFKFENHIANVVKGQAHTGKHAIKVNASAVVSMTKFLSTCDPAGCNLGLSGPSAVGAYTITNGTTPYNIQYNVIYGDPTINLAPNGFSLTGAAGSSVEITITDANGCQYTTIIQN